MTKKIISLMALIFALGLFFPMTVSAQDDEDNVTVIYKKKTIIDFEDVLLQGELRKPQGAFLQDRRRTKFDSLITLRDSFEREMFRTVDELK
ncbi:MAG: hypothetical protein GXP49_05705 [Deltaproteobacteria bacterium]|nr:hypothetical protein [Deltaproteobacteria bacterium]